MRKKESSLPARRGAVFVAAQFHQVVTQNPASIIALLPLCEASAMSDPSWGKEFDPTG
jgi:hypothetical protein